MGKRVESGRDGVLMGGALAREMVYMWIMNDRPMLDRVRRIMAGEDRYLRELAPVSRVAHFLCHALYVDDGSTYRATWREFFGERFPASGFDPNMPYNVRTDFTRTDFDLIDWAGLCRDFVEDGE